MKRKYIRKALQSKSSPTGEGMSSKLPDYILLDIERVLGYRKVLGLPDDRGDRIERALRYQGIMGGQ